MNKNLRLITTVTLPLLFAIGCANTDTKSFTSNTNDKSHQDIIATQEDESNINETVKLAINNMDGYLKRIEQDQNSDAELTNQEINHHETAPGEEITDMTVLIVEEEMDFADLSETLTVTEHEEIDQLIETENLTAPDQTKFFFGFNKTQPNDADKEILAKHAEYLLSNPNTVLVINGHADNRGNKNYNQYLSLLRAENIAAILTAAGVPGNQLRVGGMGDNVPMVAANHWGENRRVELLYRDALMLSSQ